MIVVESKKKSMESILLDYPEVIEEDELRDKYKMLVFAITGQKCFVPFKKILYK